MSDRKSKLLRPRTLLLVLAALLLFLTAWTCHEVWLVHTAEPNPSVDYGDHRRALTLEHIEIKSEEQAQRAWRIMRESGMQVSDILAELENELWDERYERPGDTDVYVALELLYETQSGPRVEPELRAMRRIEQAGIFEAMSDFTVSAPGIPPMAGEGWKPFFDIPELGWSRSLSRALLASAHLALVEGRSGLAIQRVEQTMAVMQSIAAQPLLIPWLIGAAIEAGTLREVRFILLDHDFGLDQLRRLLAALDRRPMPPLEMALRGERLQFHDFVQHTYSDDGSGDGYMIPRLWLEIANATIVGASDEGPDLLAAFRSRFLLPTRTEMLQAYDRQFEEVMNDYAAGTIAPPVPAYLSLNQTRSEGAFTIVDIFQGALERSLSTGVVLQTERAGTRLMLALEFHRAEQGTYPETLDALAPAILPEIPDDPMHGGPFGYRLVEDDAYGRGYILYAYGWDGIDDGGLDPEHGDLRFRAFGPDYEGTDFIFNAPRSYIAQ